MTAPIFTPGPVTKGDIRKNNLGDIYEAKRDIKNSKAQPKAGTYWKLIATKREGELLAIIENLKAELAELKTPDTPDIIIKKPTIEIDLGKILTSGVDAKAALMELGKKYAGKDKGKLKIFAPNEALILTSDPRWTYGLHDFDIFGNGSTFRSIHDNPQDGFLSRPFVSGSLWHTNTLSFKGSHKYATNFLFEDVEAGSDEIIPLDKSILKVLKPGNRLQLYFFDRVGNGWPYGSSATGHEIVEVKSVTGVSIKLTAPLINSYWNDIWDVPNIGGDGISGGSGRPRFTLLDRPEYSMAEYAGFHDLVWGDATGGKEGSLVYTARKLFMNNVTGEKGYLWPSENEEAIYEGCDVGDIEWDKIVGSIVMDRCRIRGIFSGGMGVRKAIVKNCIAEQPMNMTAYELHLENNTNISGNRPTGHTNSISNNPGRYPQGLVTLKGLTFDSDETSKTDVHIQRGGFTNDGEQFTNITVEKVSGNTILIPFDGKFGSDFSKQMKSLDRGTVLIKSDGSKAGRVIKVGYNGQEFTVELDFTPEVGDRYKYTNIRKVIDYGGHTSKDGKRIWGGESLRWAGNTLVGNENQMVIIEKDLAWNEKSIEGSLNFFVRTFEVDIFKPTDAVIYITGFPEYKNYATIDCSKKGTTTLDLKGWIGDVHISAKGEVPELRIKCIWTELP